MGVRGLQTYINKHCPHVKEEVCIFDLADQHGQHFNLIPKLVIDGSGFTRRIYEKYGNLEWIYGGQWLEYKNVLQQFLESFKNKNVKLVFFFDGHVVEDKRSEWVRRTITKYSEIAALFDDIRKCQHLPEKFEQFEMPTSMNKISSFVIKILCPEVEVYATLNDADIEIADYARRNKDVFGILSNDTDFIIFDSKPYLSLKELDFITMRTVLYNRNSLSQHLSLPLQQLPLFACLAGNDFISRDMLRGLHQKLRVYPSRSLHDAVSIFIRHQHCDREGEESHECKLSCISRKICGDGSLKEILSQGIAIYTEFDLPVVASCVIGKRSNDCTVFTDIFNIYKHRTHACAEVLEDYRDTSLPSSNLAYRPLRRRLYAIIFNNQSANEEIFVQETCAYFGNTLEQPECIYPLYIPALEHAPPIEELWHESLSVRLKYFVLCLKTNLSESEIQTVEPKLVTLCCIINYLLTNFESPFLKKFEILAFIAQAVYIQNKTPQQIHAIKGPNIETRPIHLCSLFMRGVSNIILALGVCGYPISLENAMPWNYFDGKVFHKMYELAKKDTPIPNLLESKEPAMKLFNKLYNTAIFGVNHLL